MARRHLSTGGLVQARLADPDAERVRAGTHRAIRELQDRPVPRVIADVVLPNNTEVIVRHAKGLPPVWIGVSCIRHLPGTITGGVITQYPTRTPGGVAVDPAQAVVLIATGFGMAVTVDVVVF